MKGTKFKMDGRVMFGTAEKMKNSGVSHLWKVPKMTGPGKMMGKMVGAGKKMKFSK